MMIGESVDAIVNATHTYRLQKLQAQYDAGQRVDFKYFQISTEGIHVKRATLPWAQVSHLQVDEEETIMVIRQVGQQRRWKVVWIDELPNQDIMGALIGANQPHLVRLEED